MLLSNLNDGLYFAPIGITGVILHQKEVVQLQNPIKKTNIYLV